MPARKFTPAELLQVPMAQNDAKARTVGEYLAKLLFQLWKEEDGFSGKRPFGNSDWQSDIAIAFKRVGLVCGVVDADGFLEEVNEKQVLNLIRQCCTILVPVDDTP